MSQRDVVCCSVLQRILVEIERANFTTSNQQESQCVAVCCSVLQCVAVCCSVLQCVAVCCSMLQCVAKSQRGPDVIIPDFKSHVTHV